ncbi:Uma2 family endonuclease [Microseira sp. BLCC-F43]|jgi:Uma2 family endonuclease|uniref:Uma2 family endonuclease n=1 Tax=Microseira sp. BLCC-F43 TaxID=3153602 RepID=UPI0035B9958D
MTETASQLDLPPSFPDHTQLPESDGTFVKNFQEHPQSIILTDSIGPVLQRLRPDGQYCIGQDSGIYWRETDPPEKGAEAPDWFCVLGVPPDLDGVVRRSYVLWREFITPTIALEFASGDGSEEKDTTQLRIFTSGEVQKPGKFWVYETIMRIPFYGIFQVKNGSLEMYHLIEANYQKMTPNERGHYPITPLEVELGVWQGTYQNQTRLWLRWWDMQGNLLLIGDERAAAAEQKAIAAEQKAIAAEEQAAQERQLREALLAQLRARGIDPDTL